MSTKYLGDRFDIHGGGMDLLFPHHECEIAQSTVCNHVLPARYWLHNNMITINGRKMGKSYNNVIKLTELFSGQHALLEQAYSPMTIRFFILQTHYRSTLDFGNEALKAAEKGLRRLWESYEVLKRLPAATGVQDPDAALDAKVQGLLDGMDEYMSDDFNTAKVLANLFELVPVINGIRDGHVPGSALRPATYERLSQYYKAYLEDILGLQDEKSGDNQILEGVLSLLVDLRKDARSKKDYATSDKIRNQLLELGVLLKDEKDGGVSITFN
jgi:cysteinyl-tRNA synthetase